MTQYLFVLTILALTHVCGHCSVGDDFPSYRNCILECTEKRCYEDGVRYKKRSCYGVLEILKYKCSEKCEYDCMWPKIEKMVENEWLLMQFDGKWLLKKLLQEPVSVTFSVINLLANLVMFIHFKEKIRFTLPSCKIWFLYTLVSTNRWIWSAVYHGRHTMFTELMDNISTYAMVLFAFYAIGHRVLLYNTPIVKNTFMVFSSLTFIYHSLDLLLLTEDDYECNMNMNIFIGEVTNIAVFIWAILNYRRMNHGRYLILYVLGTTMSSLLKLLADFPPLLWSFDAHSLWHLTTVPNAYFMYKFAIKDCKYQSQMLLKWPFLAMGIPPIQDKKRFDLIKEGLI